jgi:hypothetical protein
VPLGTRVILSSHDFKATPHPAALARLAADMRAAGADIVKIAAFANDITDAAAVRPATYFCCSLRAPRAAAAFGTRRRSCGGLRSWPARPLLCAHARAHALNTPPPSGGSLAPGNPTTTARC